MRLLIPLQALLTVVFICTVWIHAVLRGAYGGDPRPTEPGFLQWWYDLPWHLELDLILLQVFYPLFWWFTRKQPWTSFWRGVRLVHLIGALGVVLLVVAFLLFSWVMEMEGGWRQ